MFSPVMESRDLVLVSRRVSRPIFASFGLEGFRPRLGFGLEGCRSRSLTYYLEILNILHRYGLVNFCSVFLSAVFADKKQPKQVGKMPVIRKICNFEVVMTFLGKFSEKYQHNPQILKSRSRIF